MTTMLLAMTEEPRKFMMRSGLVSPHDQRATERWLNEGGHVASDAVLEREAADDARRTSTTSDRRATTPDEPGIAKLRQHPEPTALSRRARRRVVIAGGGVAGLETLLALHSLAEDRVDITLVEPELTFVNRSMAVMEPFKGRGARGVRTQDIAGEFGAHWIRRLLERVSHEERVAITRDGMELPTTCWCLQLELGVLNGRGLRTDSCRSTTAAMYPITRCCSGTYATAGPTSWRSSGPLGRAGRCRCTTWRC